MELKVVNPTNNFTPEETDPEKVFMWRKKIHVPADLVGWDIITDPEDLNLIPSL